MYGGDNLPTDTNTQNREVTQFHLADHTMVHTAQMNRLRWYSSATMLPNGEVYVQGGTGGADLPERRTSSGTFQLLTGASTNNLSSGYPKNWVGPDGLVFGIANTQMYRVNPAGNGSISMLGTIGTGNTGGTSTAVMFEPGRILQVGGGGTRRQPQRQHHRHQHRHTAADRAAAGPVRPALGQRHGDGRRPRARVRWERAEQRRERRRLHRRDLQPGQQLVVDRRHGDPDASVPLDIAPPSRCHRDHDGRRHARSGDQPQRRDLLPAVPVQRRRHRRRRGRPSRARRLSPIPAARSASRLRTPPASARCRSSRPAR